MSSHYFIGLMSGTSADGVDAALVKFNHSSIELIDFIETAMPKNLQATLIELNQSQQLYLHKLSELHKDLAELFANAANELIAKNHIQAEAISAIGSHGQTIYHAPDIPMTLQVGHPAFIAKQTGITTVGDFRVDDMALGGQGAPFAPAFHQQLFANKNDCFVVNIGGIANISFLPNNESSEPILGWDTGPGNSLMDDICREQTNLTYDKNGELAQQGHVHQALLAELLKHSYFALAAPKSTGRETFNSRWLKAIIDEQQLDISTPDLLSTLAELTAISIADQIKSIPTTTAKEVWIVGGGAFNPFLITRIQAHLESYLVQSSLQKEINPSAVEAMLCAWLAHQRLNNAEVKLSAVTGATRDAVLGGIWHP